MVHSDRKLFNSLVIPLSMLACIALWVMIFAWLSDILPLENLPDNTAVMLQGVIFLVGLFASMGMGVKVGRRRRQ